MISVSRILSDLEVKNLRMFRLIVKRRILDFTNDENGVRLGFASPPYGPANSFIIEITNFVDLKEGVPLTLKDLVEAYGGSIYTREKIGVMEVASIKSVLRVLSVW